MKTMNPCIEAAFAVANRYGVVTDRCEILQDGHTLVVRLNETLVARVVTDIDGPRQGLDWFKRETAVAAHLTQHHAPVIPLHPDLPATAHQHEGYAMNFWQFVTATDAEPEPREIGWTLHQCHEILRHFPESLPSLAILHETLAILETSVEKSYFDAATVELLKCHLQQSIDVLAPLPAQPLHGDAHMGNLMMTTQGMLWTDWEDAFSGPVEWDLASIIWNAKLLDDDQPLVRGILKSYQAAGGRYDELVLGQCLIARAAVMSAWYPILYPAPSEERVGKLKQRIEWLRG
jgi:Phosphotransferase enzyme family